MTPSPQKKYKLLAYCDSPICHSGFGQVSRNILSELHKTGLFEITVFGINHYYEYDDYGHVKKPDVPYDIIEASFLTSEEMDKGFTKDMYGKTKLLKYMYEKGFDVFWSVQDPYVVEFLRKSLGSYRSKLGKKFQSIFYFPVDAANISEDWATIPKSFDFPVVYTQFGFKEVVEKCPELEEMLQIIPHGTNMDDFYPIEGDERKEIRHNLGVADDEFLILNVNRNQPRKDLSRTLHTFAEFKQSVPNSKLMLFCNPIDVGGNLHYRLKYYGLTEEDVIFPQMPTGRDGFKGLPISAVNEAYAASDVVVSTTLGEGWGLSLTEAMACRRPVVFPNNSSINEIIGPNEERGYLVKSGEGPTQHFHLHSAGDEPPRPLTDVDDMVLKLLHIHNKGNAEEVAAKVEAAYKYASEHTWDRVFEQYWKPIFEAAIQRLEQEA